MLNATVHTTLRGLLSVLELPPRKVIEPFGESHDSLIYRVRPIACTPSILGFLSRTFTLQRTGEATRRQWTFQVRVDDLFRPLPWKKMEEAARALCQSGLWRNGSTLLLKRWFALIHDDVTIITYGSKPE